MFPRHYIKLAEGLPPRLTRFFARYPPQAILPPKEQEAAAQAPSPFKPHKHPVTGKWHNPVFSLRRQAELVKLARQHGVEELLPHTVKGTEERIRRRVENGLRVKGTGVGQRVKGKESERMLKARYVLQMFCVFDALDSAEGGILMVLQ
jgi:large subunit ribosomal protein L25